MADAVFHDVPVNPCAQCAGVRKVEERDWVSPRFGVHCLGCGNVERGASADEAVQAWNEANPEREVSREEQQAVAFAVLKPMLTPQVLQALEAAFDAYSDTGVSKTAQQHVNAFLDWCHGGQTPEDEEAQ